MGLAEGDYHVQSCHPKLICISHSTVLAGGTFPGPVIKGFKGDRFLLNVVNVVTDDTMVMTTSVVRPASFHAFQPRL
jgi:FtsP/CotA-like multicopper oxidase with cupredoxin domain